MSEKGDYEGNKKNHTSAKQTLVRCRKCLPGGNRTGNSFTGCLRVCASTGAISLEGFARVIMVNPGTQRMVKQRGQRGKKLSNIE